MHQLTKWFQKQAAKEQRAVFLEDTLFNEGFARYAYYRMRFFLARSLLAAGLHIVEVVFLSVIFAPRLVAAALLVRTATGFAIAWWWGALEVMREDVRRLRRNRKSYLIARGLSQWLGLSLLASALILAGFGGWLGLDLLVARRPFDVFHLYVLANGLRLACAVSIRTFHSGVYAVRRVYRPLWSLVAVDLLSFAGTLAFWPLLGPWSLPTMLVAAFLLSSAFTFYFTAPLYRFLGLFPGSIRPSWPTVAFWKTGIATRRLLLGGCVYALTKVDSLLLFALFYNLNGQAGGYELFFLFYIIGPFIRASADWAQLYYFDLKRLELERFANFKRTFDRSLHTLAGIAAASCWILAAVCGTLFLQKNLGILYLVLAVFLFVRSRLAFFQIRAFTENRWLPLLASGLLTLSGGFACRAFAASGVLRVELFILCLLLALFFLRQSGAPVLLPRGEADLLVPLDWLAGLKAVRDRVRVRSLELCVQVDDWMVEQFAGYLAKRIGKTGAVSLMGGKRILWWEQETTKGKLGDDWIWQRGAGMIESLRTTPYQNNGSEALVSAENEQLFGTVTRLQPGPSPATNHLDTIKESFREMFPDGVLFDPAANGAQGLQAISSTDRRELMHGIVQYSRNFYRIAKSRKYEVTALLRQGEVTLVFIVEKAVHKKRRRIWRCFISAVNLGLALGPGPGPGSPGRNGQTEPADDAFAKKGSKLKRAAES
jgi:hypothetical protein